MYPGPGTLEWNVQLYLYQLKVQTKVIQVGVKLCLCEIIVLGVPAQVYANFWVFKLKNMGFGADFRFWGKITSAKFHDFELRALKVLLIS